MDWIYGLAGVVWTLWVVAVSLAISGAVLDQYYRRRKKYYLWRVEQERFSQERFVQLRRREEP